MNTAQFLDHLQKSDIQLFTQGENLKWRAPKGAITLDILARLKAEKSEIFEAVAQQQSAKYPFRLLMFIHNFEPLDEWQIQTWQDQRYEAKGHGIELRGVTGMVYIRAPKTPPKPALRILDRHREAIYALAIKRFALKYVEKYAWETPHLAEYLPHYFGQESQAIINAILEQEPFAKAEADLIE